MTVRVDVGGDSDVTVRTGLSVWNRVVAIRFGLAAFLIPLAIRSIPEIIVGPYPVGWDTIAFYVPDTLDWFACKRGLLSIRPHGRNAFMFACYNSVNGCSHE